MEKKFTFIDLFAGCGGLSEGFYQEGFKSLLHLEINPTACCTLSTRMKHYGYKQEEVEKRVLCDDITREGVIDDLDRVIQERVDVIIGGPPCQAFSTVGRAQSPNAMKNDPRNYLFENYLSILNHFLPKIFIFENVKGLLSAKPKDVNIFDKIINKMSENYKVISDPNVLLLNAINFGVPQSRERVIIIGIRKDLSQNPQEVYDLISDLNSKNNKTYTVRDAISDLPKLKPGEGNEIKEYECNTKNEYVNLIHSSNDKFIYNHVARNHNERDRERYRLLSLNGWQLKDLAIVRPDLVHHDPKHFGNRYTVQMYDKPGKTIMAHLYKDGNLFIHPDPEQERTFTVREAARIQSFPDNFIFEGSRTEQYKQVGNAVPPLMASIFAKSIKTVLLKELKK